MKIQINIDNTIAGLEEIAKQAEATMKSTLGHLAEHITCVKVHLSDKNSYNHWNHDKHCIIEARIEHQQHLMPPNVCFGGWRIDK